MKRVAFCALCIKPIRIDLYLKYIFFSFSRSFIQKMIDEGNVGVNGTGITKNIRIKRGDVIEVCFSHRGGTDILPEKRELEIVYENADFLVINKDAGMNVHPTPGENGKTGTLINALLHYFWDTREVRVGLVHRLDKNTSWLILVAKNDAILGKLQELFSKREVQKYYLAVVFGIWEKKRATITSYIGRSSTDPTRMSIWNMKNPKFAITHVECMWYVDMRYSLLKIRIETGRTHQIRVHLASMGHPIVWDDVYGDKEGNDIVQKTHGVNRQLLHAYKLCFSFWWYNYTFFGEFKSDFEYFIRNLDRNLL